jgi:hypothetical protein
VQQFMGGGGGCYNLILAPQSGTLDFSDDQHKQGTPSTRPQALKLDKLAYKHPAWLTCMVQHVLCQLWPMLAVFINIFIDIYYIDLLLLAVFVE